MDSEKHKKQPVNNFNILLLLRIRPNVTILA